MIDFFQDNQFKRLITFLDSDNISGYGCVAIDIIDNIDCFVQQLKSQAISNPVIAIDMLMLGHNALIETNVLQNILKNVNGKVVILYHMELNVDNDESSLNRLISIINGNRDNYALDNNMVIFVFPKWFLSMVYIAAADFRSCISFHADFTVHESKTYEQANEQEEAFEYVIPLKKSGSLRQSLGNKRAKIENRLNDAVYFLRLLRHLRIEDEETLESIVELLDNARKSPFYVSQSLRIFHFLSRYYHSLGNQRLSKAYEEKAFSMDGSNILDSMQQLAFYNACSELCKNTGRLENALEYANKVISAFGEKTIPETKVLAEAYVNAGLVYDRMHFYAKALQSLFKALSISLNLYNEERLSIAIQRYTSMVYLHIGAYANGIEYYFNSQINEIRLDDRRLGKLHDTAEKFFRNNEFEKASGLYEFMLTEDWQNVVAHWMLLLCKYGVHYETGDNSDILKATVSRISSQKVTNDVHYENVLACSEKGFVDLFKKEAERIEDTKSIKERLMYFQPVDVFISYKATDNNIVTEDSHYAEMLYRELKKNAYKVFCAPVLLKDVFGEMHEPYIYSAIQSCKAMVVIGTKPEYFNSPWIRNEWTRFLDLAKESKGKRILISVIHHMSPYELPVELRSSFTINIDKTEGWTALALKMISDNDGLKRLYRNEEIVNLAFGLLEEGNFIDADKMCKLALEVDPTNAMAYVGKLMAQLRVKSIHELEDCEEVFDDNENYRSAMFYGNDSVRNMLKSAIDKTVERNKHKHRN